MPPFTGDAVNPLQHSTLHYNPAAGAGTDDHPEHHLDPGRRTVSGLRQSETIGIIGHTQFPAE